MVPCPGYHGDVRSIPTAMESEDTTLSHCSLQALVRKPRKGRKCRAMIKGKKVFGVGVEKQNYLFCSFKFTIHMLTKKHHIF
jgi:hypothetical protein